MSIYICIYKFGPGLDSGSQPLTASKEIKPEHALSINKKTHAQSPIQELPYKKKKKNSILFKRENKNATLSPFNSTTALLLFSL